MTFEVIQMLTFASSIFPVADPGTWAQIINSVHDWFGVIALSLLLAGFLVFSISKEWKNKPLILTAVVGYLLLLVTAIIFISIPRPISPQRPYVESQPQAQLTPAPALGPPPAPTRIAKTADRDSGEVNYNCEQTISGVTTGVIQFGPHLKDLDAKADWPVSVNAGTKAASVLYEKNAAGEVTSITGVGSVTGQNKQWTGNCPGGGNGHVHLHATWTEDKQ